MVLGQQQVQGVDYAYTLQGWLKGINGSNGYIHYDMGLDAWTAARDAYGYTLHYFSEDYLPINYNTNRPFAEFRSNMETLYPGEYRQLFNGNISATVTSVPTKFLNQMYNYQYDQLNRLIGRETYLGLGPDNTWSTLEYSDLFKERFSYDANGNIKTVLRNGHLSANALMDSLTYIYTPGTNRLDHIRDRNNGSTAHNSNYNVNRDLKDQVVGNYAYDAIGNLKSSKWMGDDNINWNIYGKVTEIEKRSLAGVTSRFMHYYYDPSGNRVGQAIRHNAGAQAYYNYLWYVRDAQGNVLAVYKLNNAADATANGLKLAEQYIYGSSRLGVINRNQDVDEDKLTAVDEINLGDTYLLNFTRGNKLFELTNHLGSILVTVNDKRWGVPVGGNPSMVNYWNPELVSWSDYYSYGMLMRAPYLAVQYRYGFNGKEYENEVQAAGNLLDYGNRLYDPLVGRFWSVDPLTDEYPELTPYQFASNTPIQGIDLDGKEIFYHDPLAGLRLLKGMFLGWASDFSNGALKTREGVAQLGLAKHQQASYNNPNVPQYVQNRLNQNDKLAGANKMVEGTRGMAQASADAVATVVPLGEGVSAGTNAGKALARVAEKKALSGAEKAAASMANNAVKMSEKALVKSGNEAVQILEREAAKGVLNVEQRSLQHMFSRHAKDFGISGNWNKAMAGEFEGVLRTHMNGLKPIQGTYRGTQQALHYYNPSTGLNVMTDMNGNLLGGWKLSADQVKYLLSTGAVK